MKIEPKSKVYPVQMHLQGLILSSVKRNMKFLDEKMLDQKRQGGWVDGLVLEPEIVAPDSMPTGDLHFHLVVIIDGEVFAELLGSWDGTERTILFDSQFISIIY